jgi:hypothetical protein
MVQVMRETVCDNRIGAFAVQTFQPDITKKKAARKEPPFLNWGPSGQKMNLPVICAIL